MKKTTIISMLSVLLSGIVINSFAATNVQLRNPTNYCGLLTVDYIGPHSGSYSSTFLSASSYPIFSMGATEDSTITKVVLQGGPGCGGTEFTGTITCSLNNTKPLKNNIAVNLAINSVNSLYCVLNDA
ncbi:hypothetical protein [Legionella spiritensis]|uniref:Secreted protein n=1 Tax=Legionella spiritensis TaxID=452 RepID=A0A0W0YYW9_LEGSP|nr:hypothetical protein [Legionella spiritensis]KTD61822.1 hypothetical protein Lspi_2452 [Legionella spiritensis]SNV31712.1 Uncharacterised protein [Legionella spiritensis]